VSDDVGFVRVVTAADGRSMFEEATLSLAEQPVAANTPPMFVGLLAASPPSPVVFLRSSGFDSEPHPAPRRQWVVMIRGAIEVEVSDGSRRVFGPGDLLLLDDTSGIGHTTYTVGEPPFEGLFVPAD
jgi:redox-sensitive bicupin YhaK (pirin superfamily)